MTIEREQDNGSTGGAGIPKPPVNTVASQKVAIDGALETLVANKERWASLDIQARIDVLDEIISDLQSVAGRWVKSGVTAQDLDDNAYGIGEKKVTFSMVFRQLRLLRQALLDIQAFGQPQLPGPVGMRSNGQATVRVYPQNWYDRLSLPGISAEVWLQPGAPLENGSPAQAAFYQGDNQEGGVALVLGVGNVAALTVADFMQKLFVEGKVVILKPSPVNDYIGPLIEEGFRALIAQGFMRVVYGGADEGSYLVKHPLVDEIHMTGSAKTFDSIVFGRGAEGARRKAEGRPQLDKRITAELGNVSPIIVVPGPWKESDIEAQAGKLGTWLSINAGYTCLAPRIIVNWQRWQQRDRLNRAIGEFLTKIPTRKAYYPGSIDIHRRFIEAHPEALQFGKPRAGDLPWTLIPDLDAGDGTEICFSEEGFCGLFGETAIEAKSVEAYIDKAVDFANESLWGTLVCSIIVHPASMKDPAIAEAVERAIERLRYGTVVVNLSGVIAYFLMTTSWGSYPGQDIYDVQSGIGTVNNLLMLDHPQKAVVRGPFKQRPDPFLATSRNVVQFGESMMDFQLAPSVRSLSRTLWAAMRS